MLSVWRSLKYAEADQRYGAFGIAKQLASALQTALQAGCRYVPRAILMDLEPGTMDSSGPLLSSLFHWP